jgi:hypothetical protein
MERISITYVYDATGIKLQKQTIDSATGLATTTLYLDGFQYQRRAPMATPNSGTDTLQFVGHEEGRARWAYHTYVANVPPAYDWEYDFAERVGSTEDYKEQVLDALQVDVKKFHAF